MEKHDDILNRRDAMRHLVTGATALAGGGLITGCASAAGGAPVAAAQAAPAPVAQAAATGTFDMSWRERVNRPHRMVFDSAEYGGGIVFTHVTNWMNGWAAAYGARDEDLNAVIVIRHAAVPMVLNHEMWERIQIAVTDAMTEEGAPAPNRAPAQPPPAQGTTPQAPRRNPYIGAPAAAGQTPRAGRLDGLIARGAIVLACNLALGQQATRLRTRAGITQQEAVQQVRAAIIPGVYVMPNGIFAAGCAQEAGCQFFKSA